MFYDVFLNDFKQVVKVVTLHKHMSGLTDVIEEDDLEV